MAWRLRYVPVMISSILQDIRFCFRMLLKNPGFSLVAIFTLALGISINSAVFSLVNAVLLRPLPVRDWKRTVVIATVVQRETLERRGTSYQDYLDMRAQSSSYEEMAAYTNDTLTLTGLGQAEQINSEFTSGSYFSLVGVKPVLGRTFLPQEERLPLSDPPVLIGYSFWIRHFGGQTDVLGKTFQLNEQTFRIAGVLPKTFSGMAGETELWIPIASFTLLGEPKLVTNRGTRQIDALARLKKDVSVKQASVEISGIAKRLQKEYPDTNQDYDAIVVPLREEFFRETKPLLYTLLGAVLFVLLIACANVANLLVARASARQKEIALRTALGAGKNRIIQQLLTESVLLTLIGGAFGWILAFVFVKLLIVLNPVPLPAFVKIELDLPVLLFTLAICAMCGILMGLAPAFHASRRDLQDAIKESATNTTGSSLGKDVRNFLVVSEVALAVLLLIGAGLLARSFLRIQNIPLGFVPEKRVAMRISLPRVKYEQEKAWQLSNLLLERIESIPSVSSAAMTSDIPLEGSASASIFSLENPVVPRGIRAYVHDISPKFFSTTGIVLKAGRTFQSNDTKDSPPVAIISEKLVQHYWKNENPIGKRLKFGRSVSAERPWMTIVGVAAEVKHRTIVADPQSAPDDPDIYLPLSQRVNHNIGLIVRTEKDAASITASLRKEIQAIDPDIAIYSEVTMQDLVRNGTAESRFSAFLMIIFGALALTLSAIGIYGVLTFHVTQRTREIGLRLALGATRINVFQMILRHALLLTGIGLALGLIAAQGLSGLLAAQLYQISPSDPLIFASIPLLLLAVAFVAIVVPAYRAMTVEPVVALRME
jgi:predicted permease